MSDDWGSVGKPGPASGSQDAPALKKKAPVAGEKTVHEGNSPKAGMSGPGETDLVVISGPARQIAKLREQIAREPEIRSEKVLELKARIHGGDYNVPAREILKKMVEQAISEARGNRGKH